jgi:hypothetical protein
MRTQVYYSLPKLGEEIKLADGRTAKLTMAGVDVDCHKCKHTIFAYGHRWIVTDGDDTEVYHGPCFTPIYKSE